MENCRIVTKIGEVIGRIEGDFRIFRGIPYAVCERFGYPKEVPYRGVFDATKTEKDCYQYSAFRDESEGPDSFYHREFRSDRTFSYTEHEMCLNIITRKEAQNDPVLVFIHGGGFETGTIGELPYGDTTEYAKRGIVFVSLGYRLNVFSLYEGNNFGFYDLEAGIRFVHEHIRDFGGDPSRIVLIGQSAGAMAIMDLLYTKRLEGIIHGAVTMSGGGMVPKMVRPWTKKEAQPFWAAVRNRAGVNEEEIRELEPERLWEAWYEESRENTSLQAVQPSIDGVIIPKIPQEIAKEGSYLDIPMIMGVTSQDFMPYIIFEMTYSWAKLHVKQGKAPVYGYFFDRELPGGSFKAFHAADLWYLFGNMERCWRPFEKTDCDLKDQMIDYVANFVKTLDPNGEGLPEWPAISKKNHRFRHFDGTNTGLISPMACRRKEWNSFLFDKGPM